MVINFEYLHQIALPVSWLLPIFGFCAVQNGTVEARQEEADVWTLVLQDIQPEHNELGGLCIWEIYNRDRTDRVFDRGFETKNQLSKPIPCAIYNKFWKFQKILFIPTWPKHRPNIFYPCYAWMMLWKFSDQQKVLKLLECVIDSPHLRFDIWFSSFTLI